MAFDVKEALSGFTQRYIELWQEKTGFPPASNELYGIPSPCIERTGDEKVHWLPQPFSIKGKLSKVETALEICLQDPIHDYYVTQFAGDMSASFDGKPLSLIQVWSEDDFIRLQENLIGHLVTQKRLKRSPTVFIGTTDSEMGLISVCNLTGQVIFEQFDRDERTVLSADLASFLLALNPEMAD
ncbi:SecY-interacting protein [Xenorhabdus szentirmaii]|uniref:SecY-interacting protein n=1 Tax=Xenorhabdus szentirmaii TaxID=290112 RepID=UPI0019C684B0|nr:MULTISPECIES: SecY-interacting protein [unclassified Xenorhabdus]MBD2781549.1 SecY-interacting protein [Xenorhabdus sp. 38]MBD2793586.1 SecY-interacting protein [Xenorhabdus sp. CUL]